MYLDPLLDLIPAGLSLPDKLILGLYGAMTVMCPCSTGLDAPASLLVLPPLPPLPPLLPPLLPCPRYSLPSAAAPRLATSRGVAGAADNTRAVPVLVPPILHVRRLLQAI